MKQIYFLTTSAAVVVIALILMLTQIVLETHRNIVSRIAYIDSLSVKAEVTKRLATELLVPSKQASALLVLQQDSTRFAPIPPEFSMHPYAAISPIPPSMTAEQVADLEDGVARLNRTIDNLAQSTTALDYEFYGGALRDQIDLGLLLDMSEVLLKAEENLESTHPILRGVGIFAIISLALGAIAVWHRIIRPVQEAQAEAMRAVEESRIDALKVAEKAQEANQSKTKFIRLASHELRTPLNGVLGLAESIEGQAILPETAALAHDIRRSGARLARVVDIVLSAAENGDDSDSSKVEALNSTLESLSDEEILPQGSLVDVELPEGLKVLAADDNRTNRLVLKKQLERLGIDAVFVENGQEVVDAHQKGHFDLLLLDISMPVMDGVGALQAIRAAGDEVPAIAVTANTLEEEVKLYHKVGFCKVVPKPVNRQVLTHAMTMAVEASVAHAAE